MAEKTDADTKSIPGNVEEENITQAFKYLKEQATDQNVNCTLEIGDIVHQITRRKIATNLFLIAQEALQNAIVHGDAKNINISITEKYKQLYLQIKDDGAGLNSSDIKDSEGKGIEFMKHSAEEMNGRLRIRSGKASDDYNTYVRCTVPKKILSNT